MSNVIPAASDVRATDTQTTANDSVSVGTSSATVAAANPDRICLWVSNDHATQVLYLSLGATAVASKGIRVSAGQTVAIREFTGAVYGIASGASTGVCVAEV